MQTAAIMLMVLAMVGFGRLFESSSDFWPRLTLFSLLSLYSLLLFAYRRLQYRGGAASIIGALLLGFSAFAVVSSFASDEPVNADKVAAIWVITALLSLAGILLLRQGHRHHCLLREQALAHLLRPAHTDSNKGSR